MGFRHTQKKKVSLGGRGVALALGAAPPRRGPPGPQSSSPQGKSARMDSTLWPLALPCCIHGVEGESTTAFLDTPGAPGECLPSLDSGSTGPAGAASWLVK